MKRRIVDFVKQQVAAFVVSAVAYGTGVLLGRAVRAVKTNRRNRMRKRHDASTLRIPGRVVSIVTTAALPWRTGTSINPMLRAAHLAQDPDRKVLLVLPWLPPAEQPLLYPAGVVFQSQEEQTAFVLEEARKRTGLPCDFQVLWYTGKYFPPLGSIIPLVDITDVIPRDMADVAILEEPEHLNWFQHTSRWVDRFNHVVGIMHTNYLAYVSEGPGMGLVNSAALYRVNKWVVRIHCHKVIKLSDAVQRLPHQVTCNVHGVSGNFLEVGRLKAAAPAPGEQRFTKGAYFIGKAVWGKGYRELINLMADHLERTHENVPLDVVGAGEDLGAIKALAADKGVAPAWAFLGGRDHGDKAMWDYKVLINPCTSDVVATTTAEALAMGKWVVVGDIPCNAFFKQFPNCLTYKDAKGFSACLEHALLHDPKPMDDATLRKLSWEAATERLLASSEITPREWPTTLELRYANTLWRVWKSLAGLTAVREALGITDPGTFLQQQQQPAALGPGGGPSEQLTLEELQEAAAAEEWDLQWLLAASAGSVV